MWYFMFGQVALGSGQVDFLSTCPVGQVGFSVNVEPWQIRLIKCFREPCACCLHYYIVARLSSLGIVMVPLNMLNLVGSRYLACILNTQMCLNMCLCFIAPSSNQTSHVLCINNTNWLDWNIENNNNYFIRWAKIEIKTKETYTDDPKYK